jgi:transcriptional regulator with XRE-family HTH domain
MLLAQRLRALRAHYDWSLQELAERSGVHYVTIHRAERGSTRITAPVVIALANALHVTTDYLLGVEADASPAPSPVKTAWVRVVKEAPAPTPPAKPRRTRKTTPVA